MNHSQLQPLKIMNTQNCLNCAHPFQDQDKFCASCGQKNTRKRISFFSLVKDFLGDTFSFDSRLMKSIIPLFFFPGKLTKEFFLGKRNSYVSPVRLFLFSILFFFGMTNLNFNLGLDNENGQKEKFKKEKYFNEIVKDVEAGKLKAQENLGGSQVEQVLDSAFQKFVPRTRYTEDSMYLGAKEIDYFKDYYVEIATKDMYTLEVDEIMEKYEIEGFWKKAFLSKMIRINQDDKSFVDFIISKISWVIFFMMPFFAMVLKLLYLLRKTYYVEHFIFGMHIHSFFFIVFGVYFLIQDYLPSYVVAIVIVTVFIYLYKAIRRFYGQGRAMSIIKFLLLSISYIFIFIFGLLAFLLLSLLIY